jgi:hypothetical protein
MIDAVAIGSPAPDFVFPGRAGAEVHLSGFWAAGPALVLWLRHFG